MAVVIDKSLFHTRLAQFISAWKNDKTAEEPLFGDVDSIVVCHGKASEGPYSKRAAFQLWLLGYEFPATLMVLTQDGIHFAAKSGKANYLNPLQNGKIPVHIHVITTDKKGPLQECLEVIKRAGPRVGVLTKEVLTGPFAEDWKSVFQPSSDGLEEVDMSLAFSTAAFAIKDENELRSIREASRASSGLMKEYLVKEMADVIDSEGEITHSALAEKVRGKLEDNSFFTKKVKTSPDFDPLNLDWALDPVIQSGGIYDLKFSTPADDRKLSDGVIIAALGLRYQAYSSMLARTYIVDPTPEQEKAYKLLLKTHDAVIKAIRDGVQAKDVYAAALNTVRAGDPSFEKHFVKSVGAGVGIEIRDSSIALNAKNTRILKDGMTLLVSVGFSDLQNGDGKSGGKKPYSLCIANTVRVAATEAISFTKDAPADTDSVLFFFDDEPEPTPKKVDLSSLDRKSRSTRARDAVHNEEKEARRRENQRQLHKQLQEAGLERFTDGSGGIAGKQTKKFQKFESYKQVAQLPSAVKQQRILIDQKASTVIVPILGRPVPFHVNTIKSASITPEGDAVALRLNFVSPGQGIARKDDQPFEDPTAQFIRNLTFRSTDRERLEKIASDITELKKAATQREQARQMMADVVEQGKLVLAKDRRVPKLDMLFLRPPLDGKRMPGHIEIHQNGIRYVHGAQNTTVDVLFSNVKHLFFQPCGNELIVIIHLHLKSPIMVGKKKTYDVQFYREATDIQFDETGHRKRKHNRYGDDEEIEAEQEERRRRAELDKLFYSFTKKIQEAGSSYDIKADMPVKDLGFTGVPSRSSVWMQPTGGECLVQLTEPPFFVVALNEIELVHFERVMFGLKQFDMVIIFQDYNRNPVHINTIPVEFLEPIKDWLNDSSIPYAEGTKNLVWSSIMKTITSDPHEFFESGGWSFLQADDDSEEEEEDDDSEFSMAASDEEESEDSSDDSDSDDEDVSDGDDDDDDEDGSFADSDDDDDGDDWDTLERKAKEHDRRIGHDDGHDKKRKR